MICTFFFQQLITMSTSRLLFIEYRPLLSEVLPLTMCIDFYCLEEISRDIQGHSVGVEWETNRTNITVHVPPRDFALSIDPQINWYILTENPKHLDDQDSKGTTACVVFPVPFDWDQFPRSFHRLFTRILPHLLHAYPYMIILIISAGIAILASPSARPAKPVGVVRIGYFSRSVEFHHLLPDPKNASRLLDDNIMKQMLNDPDISSIRVSLITQKSL
jgi:hypothetical protein